MNIDVRSISIEVSSGCNLDCRYCYNGTHENNNMSKGVAEKSLKLFFSYAKKNNINSLGEIGFIGGEPLLNFKVIEYIVERVDYYKKQYCVGINGFSIVTNGTLLSDYIIDFINKHKVRVRISLDGDKVTHNINRMSKKRNDYYDNIINGIKRINTDLITVRATITKNSVPNFYEKVILPLESIGIKNYSLSLAITSDAEISLSMEEAITNARDQVFYCFKKIYNGEAVRNDLVLEILRMLFNNISRNRSCNAGLHYFGISYNGEIVPCHRFFNRKDFVMGDVDNGINELNIHTYYDSTIDGREDCKKCAIRYFCNAHCYFDSAVIYGDINAVHLLSCAFKKTMVYETFAHLFKIKRNKKELYQHLLEFYSSSHQNKEYIMGDRFAEKQKSDIAYKKKDTIELIDLNEDGILYDNNIPEKRFILNTVALVIWDLIDGNRTAAEISQEVACACEQNLVDIESDVCNQLGIFFELGFIEEVSNVERPCI